MPLNKPSGNMFDDCYTYTPVGGGPCPANCAYCIVTEKIAPWLSGMGNPKYEGELRLIEDPLKTKLIVPEGYKVFVCNLVELMLYSDSIISDILTHCRKFPDTTFLYHTKYPHRYKEFMPEFPTKTILGVTIETNRPYHISNAPTMLERKEAMRKIYLFPKTVTIEPIMAFDHDIFIEWLREINPAYISIGADSRIFDGKLNRRGEIPVRINEPTGETIGPFIKEAETFTKVKLKDNLKRLYREE